jgi:hypothetical protein
LSAKPRKGLGAIPISLSSSARFSMPPRRPIGSLGSDLAETDPLARAQVARSFVQWETMIRDGLTAIAARGELPDGTEVDHLALAMLAAIQGGLLLSQVRRDTAALEAAVDTMIEHLRALGVQ